MEVWKDRKGKIFGNVEGDGLLVENDIVVEVVGGIVVELETRADEVAEADMLLEVWVQAGVELVLVAIAITGSTEVTDVAAVLFEWTVLVVVKVFNAQCPSLSQESVV